MLKSLVASLTLLAAVAAAPPDRPQFDWNLTPGQIAANCAHQIGAMDAVVKKVLAVRGPRTFDNTMLPIENAGADLNDRTLAETFLFNIAVDKTVRDASEKCNEDESDYFTRISADPALYKALAAIEPASLKNAYQKKDLELQITVLKRSGAQFPAATRKRIVDLENELTDLGIQFARNLANDASTITIDAAEAKSLPADFVAGLKSGTSGTYVVPVNESTVSEFLNNETQADARKRYYMAYNNRAADKNVDVLQKALRVRYDLAKLFGYPNWAAYVLADKMAGTPARVTKFLNDLDVAILPKAREELAGLGALKAKDTGNPNATLDPWDVGYYNTQLNITKYSVDDEAIRQYFPVDHTIDAVMKIYSKLLGITFVKMDHPDVWYPDVIGYDVYDAKTNRYIGATYFDLYPRPGKFGHFANWPLMPARATSNGSIRPPMSVILGNWPKPAPGHPALLSHQDVVTFFHEFGHNLAALLSTAPYETLSAGFRADFVEAPSQMLENFMWQPSILKEVSSNVETGAPLPDDLIDKMVAARYVNYAYFTTRQIMLGTVDMDYHTMTPDVDTTAIWATVSKTTSPMPMPDGIHPQASFGHLFGYDAGYYGYLWSLVYAQDMFTAFQEGGLENPVVGMRYRQTILQPARTYEPDAEVKAFLGRPMDPSAFYRIFGITSPN